MDISVRGMRLQDLYNAISACPEIHGIGVNNSVVYIHFDRRPGPRVHWKYTAGERTLPWNGKWEEL